MVLKNHRSFLSVIQECHNVKIWTDVNFHHNGFVFPCHKFILGTASPVLNDIFKRCNVDSDSETLILDPAFHYQEVEQFISYVYGVQPSLPYSFSSLFPTNLQVKPDIKPEPDDLNGTNGGFVDLWSEDWGEDKKKNIDYFDDDFYDVDDTKNYEEDEDYEEEEIVGRKRGRRKKAETPPDGGYKKFKTVTTAAGKKKYECPYCGEGVYKLPKHVHKEHKEMWADFNANRRVVKRKRNYPKQCPHCVKMLPDKWHYDRHVLSHTDPKERKTKTKTEPEEEIGSFVCAKCGEEFPTKSQMKTHEYKHKNEFPCDFKGCTEIFLSHLQYCNHMLFKHQKVIKRRKCFAKAKIGNELEVKKDPDENLKHLCPECGKSYTSDKAVKKHIEYMHSGAPAAPCICNVCGKNFRNNNKLKNHMLLHEPPTKPCPFCDKLFETDHKVKKHIKSNHLEDDQMLYQCEYCQKGFSRITSYESHMNDHKNIRPYQCHICDKAYRNSFDFQQHVKKNHGVHISASDNVNDKFPRPGDYPAMTDNWSKFNVN